MALKRKETTSLSLYDDEEEEEESGPVTTKEEPPAKRCNTNGSATTDEFNSLDASSSPPREDSVVKVKSRLVGVLGARRGERADMQDAHVLLESFLPPSAASDIASSALFAVFDGHAGARAAHYSEAHFPGLLRAAVSKCDNVAAVEKSIKRIFIDTFKTVDEGFLRQARMNKPVWKDGTTATTLLVLNQCIYAANIGDSKAIVCRHKPGENSDVAIELTIDHNPQLFEERSRILKAGGFVKNGRVDGIIEVSRSIGDGQFKSRGVSCSPDVKKFTITENDRFILLACDGLWKSFSNDDAIAFVWKKLEEAKKMEEIVERGEKAEWQFASEELAAEAVRRQCGDNVSVLLIRIDWIA